MNIKYVDYTRVTMYKEQGTVIPERQVYSFVAIIESVKLNS